MPGQHHPTMSDGESVAQPACSTSSSSSEEGVHEDDARGVCSDSPSIGSQRQQRQQHPHGGHPPQRHHQPQAPAHYLQHHGTTPNYDRLFDCCHLSAAQLASPEEGGGPAVLWLAVLLVERRRTRQQQQQNLAATAETSQSVLNRLKLFCTTSERKKQLRSYGAAPNGVSNGGNNASNSNRRPSVPRQSHPPLPPTPPLDQLPIPPPAPPSVVVSSATTLRRRRSLRCRRYGTSTDAADAADPADRPDAARSRVATARSRVDGPARASRAAAAVSPALMECLQECSGQDVRVTVNSSFSDIDAAVRYDEAGLRRLTASAALPGDGTVYTAAAWSNNTTASRVPAVRLKIAALTVACPDLAGMISDWMSPPLAPAAAMRYS
uniref:Ig-like domain-containing protein n=1 Tax=Macrostomum lignano TaxID=282301 RepID=A0A1I8FFF6_9PLAT